MSEIVIIAHFEAEPGREADLRAQLEALVAPTRAEDGCLAYRLHESTSEDGRFVFYERWASREAIERHGKTDHIAHFRATREPLIAHSDVHHFEQFA